MNAFLSRTRDYLSSLLLLELLRGLLFTGRQLFKRKTTLHFPEGSGRFRGLHALRRYPNGACHSHTIRNGAPAGRPFSLMSNWLTTGSPQPRRRTANLHSAQNQQ